MDTKNLGLDDESIIEEIKEIYGDKFDKLSKEELDNLINIIRDKRYFEYEVEFNKLNEEYKQKSKCAFIFGSIFILLCLLMITFNVLYRTNTIILSTTSAITIDCIFATIILVSLIYYITFFIRFKNFVYEQYSNIDNQ